MRIAPDNDYATMDGYAFDVIDDYSLTVISKESSQGDPAVDRSGAGGPRRDRRTAA